MQRISTFKTEHSHHLEPRLAPQRSHPRAHLYESRPEIMGEIGATPGFIWEF